MTKRKARSPTKSTAQAANRLLPAVVLDLPLAGLGLADDVRALLSSHHATTIGDLLALSTRVFARNGWFRPEHVAAVRDAIGSALPAAVAGTAGAAPSEELSPRDQLQRALDERERDLFAMVVGLGGATSPRTAVARKLGVSLHQLDDRVRELRARLHDRLPTLIARLRDEVTAELRANDGVFDPSLATDGSLLASIRDAGGDAELGARIAAFCFPRDFHLHSGLLCAMAPRRFRRLARALPRIVRPHRLPMSVDALRLELAAEHLEPPHGLLLHLLRKDLRVAVTDDPKAGELVVPDPRSAQKRLVDILLDVGRPMLLDDLVFAWRERFRRASRTRIEERLRDNPVFVMVGPETWSLRDRHAKELVAAGPLADRMARRICAMGGRQNVARLLADEKPDDRTIWLVLDRLAVDPRVRMLGRGDVCPAAQRQSQAMERLLLDFRRAAGEVVTSMFLANQPPRERRLVERLLRWNRLFVTPAADRVDLLTNYPFDESRLRRLVTIVDQQLQARSGYAPITMLKAVVDRTDLGGDWLSPSLLADVLRRHGAFEVLPGDVIARADLGIAAFVMREVRQALRETGTPLTVDDMLRERPDLAEFAACLRELLAQDPLVQTPDGVHFTLV